MFFLFFASRAKSQTQRRLMFFAAFLACSASRWWWCNVAWKSGPKVALNRRKSTIFGGLVRYPFLEGVPIHHFSPLFRLLAIENRVWNFCFGLFNLKRQFFGSQLGLNFGQKTALMLWPEPRFCGSDWLYVAKAGFLGPQKLLKIEQEAKNKTSKPVFR